MDFPLVDKNDDGIRPAGPSDKCFYCNQKVGEQHSPKCVCVTKKVLIKMTIIYDISVPYFWNKEDIEFHRNEGSWCAGNAIEELKILNDKHCICDITEFEFIKITDNVPRNEIRKD